MAACAVIASKTTVGVDAIAMRDHFGGVWGLVSPFSGTMVSVFRDPPNQAFAYKSLNKRVELWSCITTIVQAQLLNPRSDNLTSCLLHLMSNLRHMLSGRPRAMIAARHRPSETEGEATTHHDNNTPENPLHPRSTIEGLLQARNERTGVSV